MKTDGAIIADNMDRINNIISWFRSSVHRETIGYLSTAFRNIVSSQSNISHADMRSVNYSIVFDSEQQFFKEHLPIRVRKLSSFNRTDLSGNSSGHSDNGRIGQSPVISSI